MTPSSSESPRQQPPDPTLWTVPDDSLAPRPPLGVGPLPRTALSPGLVSPRPLSCRPLRCPQSVTSAQATAASSHVCLAPKHSCRSLAPQTGAGGCRAPAPIPAPRGCPSTGSPGGRGLQFKFSPPASSLRWPVSWPEGRAFQELESSRCGSSPTPGHGRFRLF